METLENMKKKTSRIIDLKFLGLFLLLMVVFTTIIYYLTEKHPTVNELFSAILPTFLILTIIYTIFMAFMEFIKILNTPNQIWLIPSIILLVIYVFSILNSQDINQETVLLQFLTLCSFIIPPKLIFLLRGDYFVKKELQKEDYFRNKIIKFFKQPRYNRKEYLLGLALVLVSILVFVILETAEIYFLVLPLLCLLCFIFRRGKDIGMPIFRTIVTLFSIPSFTIILILFNRDDSVLFIVPTLFLIFFLIMPGTKKQEIIISRLEIIILIIVSILLLVLTLFLIDYAGF